MPIFKYKTSCTWFIHDTKTNKLLLQQRDESYQPYPNMWGFPGGSNEQDESPREVSYRELQEELNYRPEHMYEVLTLFHNSRQVAEHFYYIPLDVAPETLELHEGKKIAFYSLKEISTMKLAWWSTEVLPIIERYLKEL